MSEEQVRVACPACGKRFRLDPASVPEGGDGKSSRCSGCGAPFVVLREGGEVRAEAGSPPPKVKKPPVPAKRKRAPGKPSGDRPRRKASGTTSSGGTTTSRIEPPLPQSGHAGTPFGIGDRVGRYEIEGVVARGGMGSLFKAYDPAGNRHVALKVLVSTATELDKLRFQREIQVQGNIQHPHIMPIFDSGVIGSTRYYTMELLKDPIDLIELTELARSGAAAKDAKLRPLGTLEGLVRDLIVPVCQAIHHANVNEGVLHRDLKPGNILLDRNGLRPFVIDFGVSALLEKKNARLAHLDRELPVPLSGEGISITGTLVFMPPEQARGQADKRGDVWALGALLHYIVTGEPPLETAVRPVVSREQRIEGLKMLIEQALEAGRNEEVREFRSKLEEIESGRERTVEQLRADVMRGRYLKRPASMPTGLDAIISKAMAPDAGRRYRHALELHDDLLAWLDGRPVSAMVKGSGAAQGALYRSRLWLKRHIAVIALIVGLGAAAFALIELWPTDARVDPRVIAQKHMDEALDHEHADRPGEARRAAREALRHDPERNDAFELLGRLDAAARLRQAVERARELEREARRAFDAGKTLDGTRTQAALEEVLRTRVLPALAPDGQDDLDYEMRRLLGFASGLLPLRVTGAPAGSRFALLPLREAGGPVRWDAPIELDAADTGVAPDTTVRPGSWILRIRRERGEVYVPFVAEAGRASVDVACPIDPARVDADSVYVGPGPAVGPGRPQAPKALLWDRVEVTAAQYAAFLATLSPEEQRRRVPRMAGSLGALGEPLWDRDGNSFQPPASARRRPVEGISLYDAQAYAAYAKKRIPSAAAWAWAASGPDGRLCAVGRLKDLLGGAAHVDRPLAGVADARSAPTDRSPFGLYDMAGNVAEFTSTLGTLRGESGWFVMGGSYLSPPARALVNDAQVVPGWMPLQGVGLRCVRDP